MVRAINSISIWFLMTIRGRCDIVPPDVVRDVVD